MAIYHKAELAMVNTVRLMRSGSDTGDVSLMKKKKVGTKFPSQRSAQVADNNKEEKK